MDKSTVEYFDREVPSYSLIRMRHVIDFLVNNANHNQTLLDVGCGVGNALEEIVSQTPIRSVAGLDISQKCLDQTKQLLGCSTYLGSISDPLFIEKIPQQFDYVVCGAVLHHLVGPTRKSSLRHAENALKNAFTLVKPGGFLIVSEPGIYPARTATLLFYTKRVVTQFTSHRLQLLSKWNNIGAPVISYLTDTQLKTILNRSIDGTITGAVVDDDHVTRLWRLCGIKRRINTTIFVQKPRRF